MHTNLLLTNEILPSKELISLVLHYRRFSEKNAENTYAGTEKYYKPGKCAIF